MILSATPQDIPVLNNLINLAYRGESSKKGWTTEASLLKGLRTTEQELKEIMANPMNTLLKFNKNNTIVGCVLLVKKEQELYLGMLTVLPELQNSGIGKKLLQEAEKYALQMTLPKIRMQVLSVRQELISWYQRKGYVDLGERNAFPESNVYIPISNSVLEFMVLEKKLESNF